MTRRQRKQHRCLPRAIWRIAILDPLQPFWVRSHNQQQAVLVAARELGVRVRTKRIAGVGICCRRI
jgi:hypothetical protein